MSLGLVTPHGSLTIEQDQIDVTPSREPDPEWCYRDAAGHEHRWRWEGTAATIPTCLLVLDAEGTDEYPALSHCECQLCGEHVRPGWRTPDFRRYAAGLRRYYIDGRRVSEEEARRAFPEICEAKSDE